MFKLSTVMSCGVESLFANASSCGIFAFKLISGLVPLYARSCETMSTPLLTSRTSTSLCCSKDCCCCLSDSHPSELNIIAILITVPATIIKVRNKPIMIFNIYIDSPPFAGSFVFWFIVPSPYNRTLYSKNAEDKFMMLLTFVIELFILS
jgi:hypothetical protein